MAKNNKQHYYFGRNAIYATLNILHIGEGDEILTPAWDCNEVLQPFRKKGCNLIFYQIDPLTLQVNLEHLLSKISSKTKLIHIINQFGQVQDWDKIQCCIKQYKIPILEDNAYSFHSMINDRYVGTFGDFSVFSFRKVIPVFNGSALIINGAYKNDEKKYPLAYIHEIKHIPFFLLDMFCFNVGIIARKLWSDLRNKQKMDYNFPLYSNSAQNYPILDRGLIDTQFDIEPTRLSSQFSQFLIKLYTRIYLKKISPIKIKNYHYLVEKLKYVKGIIILNANITTGIIPTVFSMLVIENRDEIFYKLRKEGFPVSVWPTLSMEVLERLDEFPDVELLGRCLLQIDLFNNKKNTYIRFVKTLTSLIEDGE